MDLQSSLDAVILATGDVDLSHVCFKLREYGKTVEGVMPRGPLADIVKNSVDRLRIVDPKYTLVKESVRRDASATASASCAVEPLALLHRAIGLIDWSDGAKNASVVKDAMVRLDSSFSLNGTGFSSFGPFINASGLFECTEPNGFQSLMVKPREQDTVPQEPDDLGELGRSELFRLCKEKGIKTGGPRVTNAHLRELLSAASD